MIYKKKDELNNILLRFDDAEMENPFINGESAKELHCFSLFDSLNHSIKSNFYADAAMILIQFSILFDGIIINKELFDKISIYVNSYINFVELYDGSYSISVDLRQNILLKEVYEDECFDYDEANSIELLADSWFHNSFRFKSYWSLKQKRVIHALLRTYKGNTSLVAMPTSAGKSIVGLALAKYTGGLTIIIMPTVALTIDQYRNYKDLYCENEIAAYYSSASSHIDRVKILNGINDETLRVLYISPEALLSERFKQSLIIATEKGYLKNIIVDECHLVNTWGSFFRTDFQILSLFIRRLYDINSSISILLLSATINDEDLLELKNLFTLNKFIELREDALRNELVFDAELFRTEEEKVSAIINQIPLLPKPLIIYTRKPTDAEMLLDKINKQFNLVKIVTFTGQTQNTTRDQIIELWNSNRLDIIVATSAFGMGVDKKNVRSVVHHKIPSNLKDYYQEAGRGGRDRLKSYSKIYFSIEDYSCFSNSLLTSERFIDRWFGLIGDASKVGYNEYQTVLDSVPIDLIDSKTGRLNQAWNEYVLLGMSKMSLIDLLDICKSSSDKIVKFRVNEPLILDKHKTSINLLTDKIEEQRNISRISSDRFKDYIGKIKSTCISDYLIKEFPVCKYTCSGCYYCNDLYISKLTDFHRYSEESFLCDKLVEVFGKRIIGLEVNISMMDQLINIIIRMSKYPVILEVEKELYLSLRDHLGESKFYYTNNVSSLGKEFIANNILIKIITSSKFDLYSYLNNLDEKQNVLIICDSNTMGTNKYLKDEVDLSISCYFFNERLSI